MKNSKDFLRSKGIKDTLMINGQWEKEGLSALLDEFANQENDINYPDDYDVLKEWIYEGASVWTRSMVGFAVKVSIVTIDWEEKEVVANNGDQSGVLDFYSLYRSEFDCPTR